MKSLKLSLLVFITLLGTTLTVNATHIMGADISYKSKGGNKYEITIRMYRDCRGIPISAPASIIRCNGSQVATFTPTEINVREITPLCAAAGKACNPPNTTSGKGVEEHTYVYTHDFTSIKSGGCCKVEIGTGQCCRNSDITTGGSNSNFWVSAYLDICQKKPNNSPVFDSEALAILVCNRAFYYSMAASDYGDNDSLVYEMTDPMQDWSQKTTWGGGFSSKEPLSVYYPSGYNKANGPDPKANPPIGFFLDKYNGSLIFMPTDCSESSIMAVKVTEYRKDSATGKYNIVGIVTRDWQLWSITGSGNNNPLISGPDTIYVADSMESSYVYYSSDTKVGTVLNDTVKLRMLPFNPVQTDKPSFSILDPKQRNPIGVFKWKPKGIAAKKPFVMYLEARDNGCTLNAIVHKAVAIKQIDKSKLAFVEGTIYYDINKNCKRDSFEYLIAGGSVVTNKGNILTADANGYFSGWLKEDSVTFKPFNPYSSFVCSKNNRLKAGQRYSMEIGGLPSMHISGVAYEDSIKNCKVDNADPKLNKQYIYTEPGGYVSTTNSKGEWDMKIPGGNYKIMVKLKKINKILQCQTKPDSVSGFADTVFKSKNIAITDSFKFTDAKVSLISSNVIRRGFKSTYTVNVKNNGNQTIQNASVWFKFKKNLKFVSASSSYAAKTDTTLKFSLPILYEDDNVGYNIVLNADTSTCKLGDKYAIEAWLDTSGLSKDFIKTNNSDKKTITVVAAVDPNIKQEHNTNGFAWREGNKLRYHVQFQNTGTDTAVNITVIDTLSPALVPLSLEMLGSSHAYDYNLNNNILRVTFPNIYLPDTATNKEKSIGQFEFEIDIDPRINKETRFYNRANIYFDFAKPVQTNKQYITYTSYVSTGQTNKADYCGSDTIKIGYSSKFSFNSGNKFEAVLSNPLGSFTSGTKIIYSSNSTSDNGNLKIAIPSGTQEGTKYRIMVVSNNPKGSILEDGVSNYFGIGAPMSKPGIVAMDSMQCGKDSLKLNINTAYKNYKIYDRNILVSTDSIKTPKVKIAIGKHYFTVAVSSKFCSVSSDTLKIISDKQPTVTLSSSSHSGLKVCGSDTVTLDITGTSTFDLLGNTNNYIGSYQGNKVKVIIPANNEKRSVIGYSTLGCRDTSNILQFTRSNKPNVSLSISDPDFKVCAGTLVTFEGSGAEKYQLYKNNLPWLSSFTKNISSADFKSTDKISLLGTNTSSSCFASTLPISITVLEAPVANFTAGKTCNLNPISFTFTGKKPTSPIGVTFSWNFGGESVSSLENPSLILKNTGKKAIKLKMLSSEGCSDSISKDIDIKAEAKADFNWFGVCEDSATGFRNKTIVSTGKANYTWYLGDGKTSNLDSLSHLYKLGGIAQTFNVKLKAYIPNGCSDSITKAVTVNAAPVEGFTYTIKGQTVNFTALENQAVSYQWTFGDGGTANNTKPQQSYSYSKFPSGKYMACLKTTNNSGCHSDSCLEITITGKIKNFNSREQIRIYPNPASDYLIIETGELGKFHVSLIDITGKLVKEETFVGNKFEWQLKPAKGFYYLKIVNEKGESENLGVEFK